MFECDRLIYLCVENNAQTHANFFCVGRQIHLLWVLVLNKHKRQESNKESRHRFTCALVWMEQTYNFAVCVWAYQTYFTQQQRRYVIRRKNSAHTVQSVACCICMCMCDATNAWVNKETIKKWEKETIIYLNSIMNKKFSRWHYQCSNILIAGKSEATSIFFPNFPKLIKQFSFEFKVKKFEWDFPQKGLFFFARSLCVCVNQWVYWTYRLMSLCFSALTSPAVVHRAHSFSSKQASRHCTSTNKICYKLILYSFGKGN